jgi:hypothetical protein
MAKIVILDTPSTKIIKNDDGTIEHYINGVLTPVNTVKVTKPVTQPVSSPDYLKIIKGVQ